MFKLSTSDLFLSSSLSLSLHQFLLFLCSSGCISLSLITCPPPYMSQWFHFGLREARVASPSFPAFISVTALIALCCASTPLPLPPFYGCHQFSHLFHLLSLRPACITSWTLWGPTLYGLQSPKLEISKGFLWKGQPYISSFIVEAHLIRSVQWGPKTVMRPQV